MSYQSDAAVKNASDDAAARDPLNRAAFHELIARHGLLGSGEANYKLLVDYCQGELTVARAEFLLANPKPGFQLYFLDERDKWIEKILALLHDPSERRFTAHDSRMERVRMQYWSRMQLKQRHDELFVKQTLAQKSAAELKADLAAVRKADESPWPGYPRLLSTTVPRGYVQAIPTGQHLRWLAKNDLFGFKKACSLYGVDQVNFWLGKE